MKVRNTLVSGILGLALIGIISCGGHAMGLWHSGVDKTSMGPPDN